MLNFRSPISGRNALALVTLMTIANTCLGSAWADEGYPFDMKKKYPKAFAAFQKIVPVKFKKEVWVSRLDGTAGPMSATQCGGKTCLTGSVCQPHDCGDNQLAFVIAEDGSTAVGLLRSANLTQGKDVILGKPDAAQLALLSKQLSQ